jgi:RNA polymerase sigma-70 factor (ECF subfamily)
VCRRVLGHDGDADDAAQDAMIAIVKGLPRFDGRSAFGTWAYRVATNVCLDELRRRRRRPLTPLGPLDALDGQTAGPAPVLDLDALVTDRIDVDAALAELPEEFRLPVVMRDLLDFDYAEIATTLGIPPGTVRSRIARGRAALARTLGNPSGSPERPSSRP